MTSHEDSLVLRRIKQGPLVVLVEVDTVPDTYIIKEVDTWDDAVTEWVDARRHSKDGKVFICMPIKLEVEPGLHLPPETDDDDEED